MSDRTMKYRKENGSVHTATFKLRFFKSWFTTKWLIEPML